MGQGKAFKEGWIKKDKDLLRANVCIVLLGIGYFWTNGIFLKTKSITDTTREQLQKINDTRTHPDQKVILELRKRKLITMQKVISFEISKGPKYAREFLKEETDLTADMLARYGVNITTSDDPNADGAAVDHGKMYI